MMFKKKGETILEILVAITVVVIIITSTYSLLLQAMKTNTTIKNRIVALNIAREGLEGVRNIRDTNWLRYSGNRREKWLCRDAFVDSTQLHTPFDFVDSIEANELYIPTNANNVYLRSCSHTSTTPALPNAHNAVIEPGGYILQYVAGADTSYVYSTGEVFNQYVLEPQWNKTAMNTTGNRVFNDTITPTINPEDFRLYIESHVNGIQGSYTHNSIADETALPSPTENERSIYYRKIIIDRVHPFEDPESPGNIIGGGVAFCTGSAGSGAEGECADGKIKVTSIVEWKDKNDNWQNVILETHLFDFYQRTNY